MRAKLVFEKFEEKSDPLRDMGIGIESYRDSMKKYRLKLVFPAMNPIFRKALVDGFGASLDEIYFLAQERMDTTYMDQYDKDMREINDNIHEEIKKGKKIHELTSPAKNGYTVKVYRTSIGKLGLFRSHSSYITSFVGDLEAILKIKKII